MLEQTQTESVWNLMSPYLIANTSFPKFNLYQRSQGHRLQKARKENREIGMSKQYPECPLYNHDNCREIHNRNVCALVRKDKECLKKLHKSVRKTND